MLSVESMTSDFFISTREKLHKLHNKSSEMKHLITLAKLITQKKKRLHNSR